MFSDQGGFWRHEGWGEPAALNGVVHLVYAQHGAGTDPGDVFYIRSTDSGVTFAAPLKLNTDSTTRPQWQPNISVSPAGTLLATWYDARESTTCTKGNPGVPCYRMWARKSTDNGVTWLADMSFSDVVTPLPGQSDPNIVTGYAGDYDYGSALQTTHVTSWDDGRVTIGGQSQQDTFFDQEPAGAAGNITLSAAKRKVNGINTVRLTWSGANSNQVDIYRCVQQGGACNPVVIVTTANDGDYVDSTGDTGQARYQYRVCEAGTQTCSNIVTAAFQQ